MTIQSAIYLAGNKRKLYPSIAPHIQDGKRKVLIDLFGGSGTVSINAVNDNLFEKVIYNDKAWFLYGLQNWLKSDCCIGNILTVNNMYSKDNAGYLAMRTDYNYEDCSNYAYLYNLQCRSNSNMMRFSSKGFNVPFGERHCCDIERVKQHKELIKDVELRNLDFGDMIEELLEGGDLSGTTVYSDCPYQFTTATYNESGGWSQNDNTSLLEYYLELYKAGAKVVISNVFENRGNVHQELIDWCELHKDKFDVHHLSISYNNSSFRKGKGKTDEVLIVSK